MKQLFSILLLLFLLAKSYAQDTIYLKNVDDTFATQKEKAIYFKVIDNKVNPIEVKTYYANGVSVSKEHFISLLPKVREGEYESYFYNGNTNIKGTFKDDKMEGSWIAYNKEKGFLETKATYKNNLLSGKSFTFYETGKLKIMDLYVRDTLVQSTCYDSIGNVIDCEILLYPKEYYLDTFGILQKAEINPSYPGGVPGIMRFLGNNIVYPVKARDNGKEGKVIIKFIVDIDGSIKNIIVIKNTTGSLECEQEAVRVIKKMAKWTPGFQKGKAVKVYYTLPISFKLS